MAINILFYPIISHSLVLSQSKDVAVINQDKVFELDKSKASLVNVTFISHGEEKLEFHIWGIDHED